MPGGRLAATVDDMLDVPAGTKRRYRAHLPVRALLTAILLCLVAATGMPVAPSAGALAAAGENAASWAPGVDSARRYAERRTGDVGFAIVGLDGRMDGFREERTAPAASVFKAMLLVAYLRQARDRPLHDSDRSLLGPMIRRSDNEAATRVRDIVGRRAVRRLAGDAGMRDFSWHSIWGLSRTSARDQAWFFHRFESYVPNRHDRYARRLLSSIVASQRWGVARVRPDGWKLFFKGGWGSGTGRVDHQVAFLERYGHRVSLAILTEFSPSHRYGKRTLKGVAARLLEGLPKLAPGG